MTDDERKLLLAVAEAIRALDFGGFIPSDVLRNVAGFEVNVRQAESYRTAAAQHKEAPT